MTAITVSTALPNITCHDEAIAYLSGMIAEAAREYHDIMWMAQPTEEALYVHASEVESFAVITEFLNERLAELNATIKKQNPFGTYRLEIDQDRHCIDIYHSHLNK